MPRKAAPMQKRLLAKRAIHPETNCWEWKGYRGSNGYGQICLANGKSGGKNAWAHREAYRAFVGEIGEGLCVLHHCDNPACFNPEHLYAGTLKDNQQDCIRRGRDTNRRGENTASAKLDKLRVRIIRRSNLSQRELGRIFGVSKTLISFVRRGKIWKVR